MDNNKIKKKKIAIFQKNTGTRHFTPTSQKIPSDVLGSYTGTPINRGLSDTNCDLFPVQDADDL